MWTVYLVECTDGSLYCGIAKDLAARLAKHDAGKGAKYTRGRGPVKLVCRRDGMSHGDALRLERAVKKRSRTDKVRFLTEADMVEQADTTVSKAVAFGHGGSTPSIGTRSEI
jgi:putative endonuclease